MLADASTRASAAPRKTRQLVTEASRDPESDGFTTATWNRRSNEGATPAPPGCLGIWAIAPKGPFQTAPAAFNLKRRQQVRGCQIRGRRRQTIPIQAVPAFGAL